MQPSCKTRFGCPIGEELAADPEINEVLNSFIEARTLYELNELPELLKDAYKEIGLLEDRDTLLQLELLWTRSRSLRQQNGSSNARWKKIL